MMDPSVAAVPLQKLIFRVIQLAAHLKIVVVLPAVMISLVLMENNVEVRLRTCHHPCVAKVGSQQFVQI